MGKRKRKGGDGRASTMARDDEGWINKFLTSGGMLPDVVKQVKNTWDAWGVKNGGGQSLSITPDPSQASREAKQTSKVPVSDASI